MSAGGHSRTVYAVLLLVHVARPTHAQPLGAPETSYETTVTAHRPVPDLLSASRISATEIAALPKNSAEEVLRQVPGLVLVQHGSEGKGQQFFLRGFDAVHGADFEVTVNGIPLNEWSNIHAQGYVDLGFVIPELIRDVEVIKGPFVLSQGPFAMAGSARFRLGVPADSRGWRAAYTGGSTNRHRLLLSYAPEPSGSADFVGAAVVRDEGYGHNRRSERAAMLGRKRLLSSARFGQLGLLVGAQATRFELPGAIRDDDVAAGRIGFYDTYYPAGRGLSARALGGLDYELTRGRERLALSAWFGFRRLELRENFTGRLVDPADGDAREQLQDSWDGGARGSYRRPLHDVLELELGGEARTIGLDQREDALDLARERSGTRRALRGFQGLAAGLAGLTWRPGRGLRFDLGVRLDAAWVAVEDQVSGASSGLRGLFVASPRFAGRYRMSRWLELYSAYGRGVRPAEARAFTSFAPERQGIAEDRLGTGSPRNTVSDAAELGLRVRAAQLGELRAAGFATFIERESVFDHVSGVNLELNRTRRLGTELVIASRPTRWLRLTGDVTIVDARFVDSGNRIPFAPWLVAGARAFVETQGGWRAGARLLFVPPRTLPHGARGSAFASLDATLGYRWRWLRAQLELQNLLGLRLRDGEYHYASSWRADADPSEVPALHHVAGAPFNARVTVEALF